MNSEAPNQDNDKTVNTQISAVTVYTNQALVTRRGTVALNGQERELVIAGLPVTIQTDSVITSPPVNPPGITGYALRN